MLLELALNGHAPAALVFRDAEDILTLGAFIAGRMFDRPVAVLRLSPDSYDRLAHAPEARIEGQRLLAGDHGAGSGPGGGRRAGPVGG